MLNDVLLPAMKEVGDKFGAGELILPFVLQSAEVMKKAVAQLEKYLDRIEGYTKGTVVLATVFGDVHDIGKSLVNTILTNNGYTVVDLGKQVPIATIIEPRQEHDADRDRPLRAARLDLEADAAVRAGAARARADVPGADRRRRDQPRLRPAHPLPDGERGRRRLRARRLLLQGRVRGPREDGRSWSTTTRAPRWSRRRAPRREAAREAGRRGRRPADDRRLRALAPRAPTCPCRRRRGGACARSRSTLDEVYPHLDTHVLFKLHWGGRGVKGDAWRELRQRELPAAPGAHVGASRTTCTRARSSATSPAASEGNEVVIFDPEDHESEIDRLVFPRQPRTTASASPTSTARSTRGETDVVALQVVTAGDEVTELMAQLERDGEFAEQLFVHGLGVQTAEGMAEWLHAKVRADLGIELDQGRRYSWGYPACPDQSEHEKVFALLDAPSIGMRLSGGYAVEPEQSTVAIVAHHPQAVYFGMRSGFLPEGQGAGRHHRRLRPRPRRCSTRIRATGAVEAEVERAADAAGVD